MMEPASDSDSESDSSISVAGNGRQERRNDDDVPQSRRNRRMTHHEHDDSDSSSLPSSSSDDDDDGDSSSDDDNGDSDDGNSVSSSENEEEPADDTDLQSRLQNRKTGDATFGSTSAVSTLRRKKAGRKEAALSLASERLAAFRKEKQRKQQTKSSRGAYGSDSDESDDDGGKGSKRNMDKSATTKANKKKKSKHAPTEASSRRTDYYKRGAPQLNSSGIGVEVGANRYRSRDPRLENMSGRYDEEVFEKRYAFLDDMRQEEMAQLAKRIAARRATGKAGQKMRRRLGLTGADGGSLEEDEAELARLKQDKADRKRSQAQRLAKRAVKKRIRDEIADGKRGAYHVKRSELKRMELEAKFDELRKRGGNAAVEKELARKRKKQESKSKRYLPSR